MGAGISSVSQPAVEPALDDPLGADRSPCCAIYHRAVEMIGRRWTGAILLVLMEDGPLRFSEIRQLVPDVSDRLLSERLKELENEGIAARREYDETPVRVEYELTPKGAALQPVLGQLKSWSHEYCDEAERASSCGDAN